MSALLAAQSQSSTATTAPASASPSGALKDLFSQIDGNGDGQISKSEFESALGAGGTNIAQADRVFSRLDQNGNGTVSLDEMSSALKGRGGGHHHHHHVASSGETSGTSGIGDPASTDASSSDPLLQALQTALSPSTTNSNGLATASLTPADLSKVTTTSLGAFGSATSTYNSVEQMIQRQVQAMSFSATPLSFNA
jgi:Ca2+-binding EF-hand superfamily protein